MKGDSVRACLIINPRSGRGGIDLTEPLRILEAHGWEVDVRQKTHGGQATEIARYAARHGYDVVVNCGGDGTLSEIIDGVVGTQVAVGSLPGGTANLWAHEIGISQQLRVAALQLASAERRRVDVGHVTINGRHGQYFMLMAGLGLDGAVISRVSKPLKNAIGPAAIGLAAAQALPAFRAVPVRVTLNDVGWEGRVSQIVIGNTRRYGAFTRMTPDAFIDDGQLDVCLITATNALSAARQFATLALRQHPSASSAEYYRASSVTVQAAQPMPMEIDGGSVSLKKAHLTTEGVIYHFSVVAQGMTMLLPRTYDNDLFQGSPQDDALPRRVFAVSGDPNAKARDVAPPAKESGDAAAKQPGGKLMKVVATGARSITAAHARKGRVYTIRLRAKTRLRDACDQPLRWEEALAQVVEGDLIWVKGKRDRQRGVITAKRITLAAAAAPIKPGV